MTEKQFNWWTKKYLAAKAIGDKRVSDFRDCEQPDPTIQQLHGEKKAARRAVDKAKREMEEELHRKLDEDC